MLVIVFRIITRFSCCLNSVAILAQDLGLEHIGSCFGANPLWASEFALYISLSMAWNPADVAKFMKGLEILAKLQGGKPGLWGRKPKNGQQTGSDKGFGRSSAGPRVGIVLVARFTISRIVLCAYLAKPPRVEVACPLGGCGCPRHIAKNCLLACAAFAKRSAGTPQRAQRVAQDSHKFCDTGVFCGPWRIAKERAEQGDAVHFAKNKVGGGGAGCRLTLPAVLAPGAFFATQAAEEDDSMGFGVPAPDDSGIPGSQIKSPFLEGGKTKMTWTSRPERLGLPTFHGWRRRLGLAGLAFP
eukprot:1808728-Amphidinium_carterae.3